MVAVMLALPTPAAACESVKLCAHWALDLEDGPWGDYLTGPSVPARGARMTIIRPAPEPPLGVFLDDQGCVTFETQYSVGHKALIYNEAVVNDRIHVKVFESEDDIQMDETHFWIVDIPEISVGEEIVVPVPVSMDAGGITNMLGTATETLHRLGGLSGAGFPTNQARQMRIWYDSDTRNASGGPVVIRLGGDANAEKFVLGHEIGHWLEQGIADSGYFPDYFYPITDPDCDFGILVEAGELPAGDSNLHGIRSAELSAGAMTEGFAHFIASAAYNDPNPEGVFRYYKDIDTDVEVGYPSYADFVANENVVALEGGVGPGTLGGQNRWVATMCGSDWNAAGVNEVSTELDWLRFWWAFYTAAGPGSQPDFWDMIDHVVFTHVNYFWDFDAVWQQLVDAINDPALGLTTYSARFTGLESTYDVVND